MTNDYEKALEDIVKLGCERILTSGQDGSALEGALVVKKCIELVSTNTHTIFLSLAIRNSWGSYS